MTATLENVDFQLFEILKGIVSLKSNVKIYQTDKQIDNYKEVLASWRKDSKELFENPEDAEFMQHAFDNISSALANDLILVTRNVKDFENIRLNSRLKLENWFED